MTQDAGTQLEIIGQNFTDGILAALRAYPEVYVVERVDDTTPTERLLLSLRQPLDTAPLVSTIRNAGGEIETVRWIRFNTLEDNNHESDNE